MARGDEDPFRLRGAGSLPMTVSLLNSAKVQKLVASPLTVFPPEFGLFFIVPLIVLPMEKTFVIDAHFFAAQMVDKINCWDANGRPMSRN